MKLNNHTKGFYEIGGASLTLAQIKPVHKQLNLTFAKASHLKMNLSCEIVKNPIEPGIYWLPIEGPTLTTDELAAELAGYDSASNRPGRQHDLRRPSTLI